MLRTLRRVLLAIGSLSAAALGVGLVGGAVLSFLGPGHALVGPGADPTAATLGIGMSIVLGGLIYRDIVRRESGSR